jgi:hypothetical protein
MSPEPPALLKNWFKITASRVLRVSGELNSIRSGPVIVA